MKLIISTLGIAAFLSSCVVQLPADPPASTTTTTSTPAAPSQPANYVTKREAYTGTVGNTKVRAELIFYSNGNILGNYVSFNSGKKYLLKGHNHFADKLVLNEYSLDQSGNYRGTSVSDLRRSSSYSKVWSGTMRNYDGRDVTVKWTRVN